MSVARPQLTSQLTASDIRRSRDDSSAYNLALSALLFFVVLLVYFPVRTHLYFNPDDAVYFTHNAHVRAGLTWDTMVWAFQNHTINWHPLTWLSHALDVELFGMSAAGPHIMNVVLHGLNAVLLFWVLLRATAFRGRSFMVAALFALHPINVEPVAWISERKTVLCTTFFLLCFAAYRTYAAKPRESRFWLVAGLFVMALLAKPQVITLPILLLLWDYWPLGRLSFPGQSSSHEIATATTFEAKSLPGLVREKTWLFLFAVFDALMTLNAQGVTRGEQPFSLAVRLENAIVSYVRYIGMAFWPRSLAPYYPHPGDSLSGWQVVGAAVLLLAVTAGVLVSRRRYLAVGWLWFLVSMVPMIGIVQVGDQALADRYAYQPFIGLFVMVCWGAAEMAERFRIPTLALKVVGIGSLVCLAITARAQVNHWKDDVTLWSHALMSTKDNVVAEFHLGRALRERGDLAAAIPHLRRAYQLSPEDPWCNLHLGLAEHQLGNFAVALTYYQRVLAAKDVEPENVHAALEATALAYQGLGDVNRARAFHQQADQFKQQHASEF
jgi:hypothetical protein